MTVSNGSFLVVADALLTRGAIWKPGCLLITSTYVNRKITITEHTQLPLPVVTNLFSRKSSFILFKPYNSFEIPFSKSSAGSLILYKLCYVKQGPCSSLYKISYINAAGKVRQSFMTVKKKLEVITFCLLVVMLITTKFR